MNNSVDYQYYFDANALFKYYQDEKGSLNIRRLVSNVSHPILVSPLTSLECLGVVMKYYRSKLLKKKQVNKLFQRLRMDVELNGKNRPFKIIPIHEEAFRLAESLLLQYALSLDISSNDALHLAIVEKLQSQFSAILVTSDNSMQKVCERLSIPFYDPETDEE